MEVSLQVTESVWIPIIFIAAAAIFSVEGPAGFLVLVVILIHGSPSEQWYLATALDSLYLGSHLLPIRVDRSGPLGLTRSLSVVRLA